MDKVNNENKTYDIDTLAKEIYDLDTKVYETLGSDLGRVFLKGEQKSIKRIKEDLSSRNRASIVRSELALISNMARTIESREIRKPIMDAYENLVDRVVNLPNSFGNRDILTEKALQLNTLNLDKRFSENDHLIICIGRTHGCAGSEIGFALADALKINYYDQEILEATRERLASSYVPENPEKHTLKDRWHKFIQYHGLPEKDAIFFNQSGFLTDLAEKEDFVIMGRYADSVLANAGIPHIRIFITAPFDVRLERVMFVEGKTEKQARRELLKLDKEHIKDFKFYTGHKWGFVKNYDFCINSASYGIEGSVDRILKLLGMERKKHVLGDMTEQ